MYYKLSLRNIRRNISDYAVYFLSISLSVMLFYVFNSINDQQVMLELTATQSKLISSLSTYLTWLSVFVAIIFFALCIFANQFMMKRRKKELGLYMTLGMGKNAVSRILVFEMIHAGIFSLIVGLSLGVLVSQGMSAFTATLFDVGLKEYTFLFSSSAMIKTIIFFTAVFILVMVFNSITVSRYTLIELIKSSKKSQGLIIHNFALASILTILSICILIAGYILISTSSIEVDYTMIVLGFILVVISSIVLYISGTSVILIVLMKKKNIFYNKINIFNIRQLSSKVKTMTVSIIVIHFLLFFTITILTSGMSYKYALEKQLETVAPYDVTVTIGNFDRIPDLNYHEYLDKMGIDIKNHKNKIVGFNLYESDLTVWDTLYNYADKELLRYLDEGFALETSAIKQSDYTELMNLQGKEPVKLSNDEVLIISNRDNALASTKTMVQNQKEYKIGGHTLKLAKEGYQFVGIESEGYGSTALCFVVPDHVVKELTTNRTIVNLQYDNNEEQLEPVYRTLFEDEDLSNATMYARGLTRETIYEDVIGFSINIIYMGIYLGLVFLVSSGAVIGLQLLADASDEQDRYKTLKLLGVRKKLINKSVFIQVASYFLAPLALAIPNAAVAIAMVNRSASSVSEIDMLLPIGVTSLVLLVLYGGYMWISYNGYNKIIDK